MKQVLDGIIAAEKEAEETVRKARQDAANLRREADALQEEKKLELKERIRRIVHERLEQETLRLAGEPIQSVEEQHTPDALDQVREEIIRLICRPFDLKEP